MTSMNHTGINKDKKSMSLGTPNPAFCPWFEGAGTSAYHNLFQASLESSLALGINDTNHFLIKEVAQHPSSTIFSPKK